jgi:hypothetical protein
MSSLITLIVCAVSMIGLYLGFERWQAEQDAACQRWATVPRYSKGQSCVRYHQDGNELTCVEWLYQQRICMDAEKP